MGQKLVGRSADFAVAAQTESIQLYFNGKFIWANNVNRHFQFLAVSGDWIKKDIYNSDEESIGAIPKGKYWIVPSEFGVRGKSLDFLTREKLNRDLRLSNVITKINIYPYYGPSDFFIRGGLDYLSSDNSIDLGINFERFVEIMLDELAVKSDARIEFFVDYDDSRFRIQNPLKSMWIRTHQFTRFDPGSNLYGEGVRSNGHRAHWGWDLIAPIGTEVYAIATGQVISVMHIDGYGLSVIQEFRFNGTNLYVLYAHLSKAHVKKGKIVRGELIGLAGISGIKDVLPDGEHHLHIEISTLSTLHKGGAGRIDPAKVLGPPPLRPPIM